MMSEPTRLLDDPAIAEGLRADLAQAQSVVLEGLDVSAGAAGLKAAIAAETTAAGAGATGAGKVLAIGLTGAVTAGALVWFALRAPEPDPKPVAAAPVVEARGAGEVSASLDPVPSLVEPEAGVAPSIPEPKVTSPSSAPKGEAQSVEAAPATRKRPRKADKQADYLREAKLISDARTAMKTDAAEALKLLTDARSEFPRGLLREEREALTILSLQKLGRSRQAKASAKRFLEKHDEGPYAEAIRQVLD